MPAPRAPAAFDLARRERTVSPSSGAVAGDRSDRPTWKRQNEHVMKWTPKRVMTLAVVGLIAWGASSATGHERHSTATSPVASETLSDAPGPTPDPGSAKPADEAPRVSPPTTPAHTPSAST